MMTGNISEEDEHMIIEEMKKRIKVLVKELSTKYQVGISMHIEELIVKELLKDRLH